MAGNKKGQRIRARHFAEVPVFDPKAGKYAAVPWYLRTVQHLFTPRGWQVLSYLMMRATPEGIVWYTDAQIAHDLGLSSGKKIAPYIKELRTLGFVVAADAEGTRYLCVKAPLSVLQELVARGRIAADRLSALNEDLEIMKLATIDEPSPGAATPLRAADADSARTATNG